ncbi:hypothetical protein GB931_13465 [Modestobacter sp. I12A-02628]|uniref:OmdA domain containing protein n=1 Tax=Goekera deserti TaxID=2497753 RepID=A0A7K3WA56_9ACTN|nr:YdeI/OmpD-associated family protein [Goekera deserti]MPQ98911.1 hypothetical protein [Goekera deserti]NDI49590.1 hypothetical protein [Goekera deserti]NEL53217.1 hypothetical protein [Goekera deserti]
MTVPTDLEQRAFPDAPAFDAWLAAEGARSPGIWLKLAKKGTGVPSVTPAEAVEVALCHGWIDGQSNRLDQTWWLVRFTPRRARSIWSQKNVQTVARLVDEGRMRPAGLAAVEAARADGRWDRAYPGPATMTVPPALAAALDAEPALRAAYDALDRTNRYALCHRVHTAATEVTRARRVAAAVQLLREGRGPHS